MSADVRTWTHGTCAAGECERTSRGAIGFGWRWVKISGEVYSSERGRFVVHSWAEACPGHADVVSAAVRGDVQEWAERWRVVRRTHDYATNEPAVEQVDARDTGTPQGMLF